MRRILIMLAVAASVSGATFINAVAEDPHAHKAVEDARFQFLAQLEGTWVETPSSESRANGPYEFHVTAGGTAIEEREMIGTPMEMLTVYHMEGKKLVGTHFCMLGNQPRVTAAMKFDGESLAFTCDGKPGNTRSHDEQHIHSWTMRLDDEGRLHSSAELLKDGKVTETPTVILTRQRTTASN
jgi:hypothetical protein